MSLPVLDLLPELRAALAAHPLTVLQAPPGAGKSTALPLELLAEPWLAGGKILMLQPRRLAARAVAARLAEGLGEPVGQTVGYRVRFESAVGAATRLEVLTEGILTRRLQHDPELAGVGLVIFDEFHERSLHADLALALCREVQGALRPDLRLLVMSATLDPALPERLAGEDGAPAPLLQSEGRSFPVELRYRPTDPVGDLTPALAAQVSEALVQQAGDVLAFLPGAAEIRRAGALLEARHPEVLTLPLYGDLPLAAQRRALLPDPAGRRKVVLATTIAETSLTIEGVRVVVDGGLTRVARSDPASGLSRLVTERVTQDAATQRAGRAGRLGPGVAYRLWSERTQAALRERRPPEILEADLAPTLLEVAQWGADPLALPWLDPPPARALAEARDLLTRLEALDDVGRLTPRGAAMLELPTHPRLAHLLSEAAAGGEGALAADLAALLEERDPLERGAGSDLTDRVNALRAWRAGARGAGERAAFERVERLSRQWRTRLKVRADDTPPDPFAVGALVALAYPERVAQRREGQTGRYKLAGGRGVRLPEGDPLAGSPFLAVARLDDAGADGRVDLAAPLDPATLRPHAVWTDTLSWDERAGSLKALSELRFGELVLESRPLTEVAPEARARAVAGAIRRAGAHLLPFTPAVRAWQARVLSLLAWRPEEGWPDVSDAALLDTLEDWLGPQLSGVRKLDDLARLDLLPALTGLLPWPLPARLDEWAPSHLSVPSGSRVRLEYQQGGAAPVLAVKLQELFGLADTPRVNGGRTPVLLHLLSPAGRPVQVTQDLRSFWAEGYFEARRDLRGRYPRHPWPDDPWTAEATKRAKPRGT